MKRNNVLILNKLYKNLIIKLIKKIYKLNENINKNIDYKK